MTTGKRRDAIFWKDGISIEYELIRSRRRTVGITVYPDGRVIVRAPQRAKTADVEAIVRKKGSWIVKKQLMFEQAPPPPPPLRYISGEKHLYLGRAYPLALFWDSKAHVQLTDDQFYLFTPDTASPDRKEKLMREWYRRRAKKVFAERLAACHPTAVPLGIPYPELKIRLMKRRWGSCATNKGSILLNLRLIQTPVPCIDFVILHELAHFKARYHNATFYALMDQLLPDWRARRAALNGYQVA
jgi:predicted metal-dependent hydrolase